jgi:hypothetical protein
MRRFSHLKCDVAQWRASLSQMTAFAAHAIYEAIVYIFMVLGIPRGWQPPQWTHRPVAGQTTAARQFRARASHIFSSRRPRKLTPALRLPPGEMLDFIDATFYCTRLINKRRINAAVVTWR